MLTAAPVEVPLRPVLASALLACIARRVAGDLGGSAAPPSFLAGALAATVPAKGWVACVPLTAPPLVLM